MQSTHLIVEKLSPDAVLPTQAYREDACFDLYVVESGQIAPGKVAKIGTGLAIELKAGWEAQVRGRSGLASQGIVAHYGTIDSEYRLEIKILLINLSGEEFTYKKGDRLAQLAVRPVPKVSWEEGRVTPTQRGGFGSSGA